jgi:hypothetical protein
MWWKHCHERIVQIRVDLDRIGIKLVEKELLPLSEHLSSSPVYWGPSYSVFSFMCMFCRSFVLFHLAIVLSVLLRYTDSDYLFDIFKHFFLPETPSWKCMGLWSTVMGLHVRHVLCCSKQINEGLIGMRVWKYTFCTSNRFIWSCPHTCMYRTPD